VFCVISHRVTAGRTSWYPWPLILCLDSANRRYSLVDEFPSHDEHQCRFCNYEIPRNLNLFSDGSSVAGLTYKPKQTLRKADPRVTDYTFQLQRTRPDLWVSSLTAPFLNMEVWGYINHISLTWRFHFAVREYCCSGDVPESISFRKLDVQWRRVSFSYVFFDRAS